MIGKRKTLIKIYLKESSKSLGMDSHLNIIGVPNKLKKSMLGFKLVSKNRG
jgi:hypothetical protein